MRLSNELSHAIYVSRVRNNNFRYLLKACGRMIVVIGNTAKVAGYTFDINKMRGEHHNEYGSDFNSSD